MNVNLRPVSHMSAEVAARYRERASRGLVSLPLLIKAARRLWGLDMIEAIELVRRLVAADMFAAIPMGPGCALYGAGQG